MANFKNALIRYRIIDKALRSHVNPFPSKEALRTACEEALFGEPNGQNICDSTIEKDMYTMKMEHDAPIKYSKKNGGYYYTDQNFSLDEIPLNQLDLEAIQFATKTLDQFKNVEMFKHFGDAVNKIIDRVDLLTDSKFSISAEYIQFEQANTNLGSEFLSDLLSACRDSKAVIFDYESFVTQKKKARKVVPLLLKEYRNRWYCISYDLSKGSIVTYALDRLSNLLVTEEQIENQIDFNPSLFFKHAVGITAPNDPPQLIVFKADNVAAKYIESMPFHSTMTLVKEGKNKSTYKMLVFVTEELIRDFLSYGPELEVVEPMSLRLELARRIKLMAERYSQ